jgi:hypothetical protein
VTISVLICLGALVPLLGLNAGKYAGVGAAIIAIAAGATKLQNVLEASNKIPTLLDPTKAPSA